jgi:hypothetical protein
LIYQVCLIVAYFACGQTWALIGPDTNHIRLGSALLTSLLTFAPIVVFALTPPNRDGGTGGGTQITKFFAPDAAGQWCRLHATVLLFAYGLQLFLISVLGMSAWGLLKSALQSGGLMQIAWSVVALVLGLLGALALRRGQPRK